MPVAQTTPTLAADALVAQTLHGCPGAVAVFLKHRMHCPGCHMAPFMTLAEAAATYGIDVDALVDELNKAKGC